MRCVRCAAVFKLRDITCTFNIINKYLTKEIQQRQHFCRSLIPKLKNIEKCYLHKECETRYLRLSCICSGMWFPPIRLMPI